MAGQAHWQAGVGQVIPPAVAWIDPGLMTGIAVLERGRFTVNEYEFQAAGDRLYGLCAQWRSALWLGWERFTINSQTHKKTRQPEAMEFIGVARYLATAWRCTILAPAQQHTPNSLDRRRLEAIGWWVPGKDDAQSAACHMLSWLEKSRNLPPREREILAAARTGR